jgi:hypothetical protein
VCIDVGVSMLIVIPAVCACCCSYCCYCCCPCAVSHLQATSGNKQKVELAPTDSLLGEASRIAVAEACVQALQQECTDNRAFALASVEGEGPGQDAGKWQQLFVGCYPSASAAKTAKSSVAV